MTNFSEAYDNGGAEGLIRAMRGSPTSELRNEVRENWTYAAHDLDFQEARDEVARMYIEGSKALSEYTRRELMLEIWDIYATEPVPEALLNQDDA